MSATILIADDDPVQRRLLEAAVTKLGHRCLTAEDGDGALDVLRGAQGGSVDLVILDLVMPGLDGMGVLEQMRELGLDRPVIVQTAQGGIETVVNAMRAGAAHLVGHHDFTTFRSTMCQAKSPVKSVDAVEVDQAADEITIHVRARSFLHNQVRSFVGSLERVGAGTWTPQDMKNALDARDRAACGPVRLSVGGDNVVAFVY